MAKACNEVPTLKNDIMKVENPETKKKYVNDEKIADEKAMHKLRAYCNKKGAKYEQIKIKDTQDDRSIKIELENLQKQARQMHEQEH